MDPGPAADGDLLRLVLEAAQGIAVVTVDDERRVRSWPTGAERLLGHPASTMVGRDLGVLFAPDQPAASLADGTQATVRLVRGDGSCLLADVTARALGRGESALLLAT
jgi:hypothetical protein